MTVLLTRLRDANRPTRTATALVVLLSIVLAFVLNQVTWPLSYRSIPVAGTAVTALADGERLLVQQDHALVTVDARTGAVQSVVPLGSLLADGGAVVRPGTSVAMVVVRGFDHFAVATVDLEKQAVQGVTRASEQDGTGAVDSVGIDAAGALVSRFPRGTPVAVGPDGRVWKGDRAPPGPGDPDLPDGIYDDLAMTPDRSLLYAAGNPTLLIDTATRTVRKTIADRSPLPDDSRAVLLTADREHLVTIDGERAITVRSLAGDVVAALRTPVRTNGIALSPDGRTLYAALEDQILAVDVGAYT